MSLSSVENIHFHFFIFTRTVRDCNELMAAVLKIVTNNNRYIYTHLPLIEHCE
jgi:hypothetical protein